MNFFVKIRAYTVTNVAMETNWVSIDDVDDGDEDHPSKENFLPQGEQKNGGITSSTDVKCLENLNT